MTNMKKKQEVSMKTRFQSNHRKPNPNKNPSEIPADPGVCTVPIRIGKATVYVRAGDDLEAKRQLWEERLKKSGYILRF